MVQPGGRDGLARNVGHEMERGAVGLGAVERVADLVDTDPGLVVDALGAQHEVVGAMRIDVVVAR